MLGMSDGTGTGQTLAAAHYSLIRLDSVGRVRWQYQYPNAVFPLAGNPVFDGTNATPSHLTPSHRGGWLLTGHAQYLNKAQLYVVEADTLGRMRRGQVVRPFGPGGDLFTTNAGSTLRLRDGSGYVTVGQVQSDSLSAGRTGQLRFGYVVKLDTALRVVWRQLLEPRPVTGQTNSWVVVGQVYERPDGTLVVMSHQNVTLNPQRDATFNLTYFSPQGALLRRETYCSTQCGWVYPVSWEYLPDGSFIVGGSAICGSQKPAWLARFRTPCAVVLAAAPGRAPTPELGRLGPAWPQPAQLGQAVRLPWQLPAGASGGAACLRLLDALGREVLRQPLPPSQRGGTATLPLPAGLAAGVYVVQLLSQESAVAARRLVVAP